MFVLEGPPPVEVDISPEPTMPYACTECNNRFVRKSQLIYHQWSHIVKFDCGICYKPFPTKETCRKHMKLHLRIKPFKCELCDKSILTKHSFDLHMKKHSRVIICDTCGMKFSKKSNLNSHVKWWHTKDFTQHTRSDRAVSSISTSNVFKTHEMKIIPESQFNFQKFKEDMTPHLKQQIEYEIHYKARIQWNLDITIQFKSDETEDDSKYNIKTFNSDIVIGVAGCYLDEDLFNAFNKIENDIDNFIQKPHLHTFHSICIMELNVDKC